MPPIQDRFKRLGAPCDGLACFARQNARTLGVHPYLGIDRFSHKPEPVIIHSFEPAASLFGLSCAVYFDCFPHTENHGRNAFGPRH